MPSTPRCIAVQTATEQYDIHIGARGVGAIGTTGARLEQGAKGVCADPSQPVRAIRRAAERVAAGGRLRGRGVSGAGGRTEQGRCGNAARLFTRLARMGADRQSVVFALGAASSAT